jgi:O-acetylhomoserine/O-acetylserine sulfhydrylase-like pyridoxal-dependent enzyme
VTFKKYGIGVKFVHGDDPKDFAAAIDEKTKAIFVESIGNPKYNVVPIPELAKVGRLCVERPLAITPCGGLRSPMTTASL